MNYLLCQLADSGFPAGGFAHSNGLEAAMQHGHAVDGASVRTFARHAILLAGRSVLPLVTAAHRAPERLAELDQLSDAFLSNPIANRASRAQGRALLSSCGRTFPSPPIAAIAAAVDHGRLAAHHAPLFGAIMKALGIELPDAQRLSLYLAGRGVTAAAVRLGLIGAYEAQQLQTSLSEPIERAVERFGHLAPLDIAQCSPLIELFQSTHDRLYSRLFQS
jgi:urease accessory protein